MTDGTDRNNVLTGCQFIRALEFLPALFLIVCRPLSQAQGPTFAKIVQHCSILTTPWRRAAVAVGMLAGLIVLSGILGPLNVLAQSDATAPTISSIAIASDTEDDAFNWNDNGVYGIGDAIQIEANFSEDVAVTGEPQLELNLGVVAKAAAYESTDGAAVVFGYTVTEGDLDSDGISVGASRLTLNGGSIRDDAGNDASLTHEPLSTQASHRVDGIRPRVESIYLQNMYGLRETYIIGDEFLVRVDFSEETQNVGTGTPQLALDLNGESRMAERVIAWRRPYFSYVIQEGDLDLDGVAIPSNRISLNGGKLVDGAGNDAILTHEAVPASPRHKVDGVRPTVSSVEITSVAGGNDTYDTGGMIEVTVTFTEDVFGRFSPFVELNIGDEGKRPSSQYIDGNQVVFGYWVQRGDDDEDGISISAYEPALNSIFRDSAANLANLNFDAVPDDANHKVAGTSSQVVSLLGSEGRPYGGFSREEGHRWVKFFRASWTDNAVTWSLSGEDSDDFLLFSHEATRRGLWFVETPNYEAPTDADRDNVYRVALNATDGENTGRLVVSQLWNQKGKGGEVWIGRLGF